MEFYSTCNGAVISPRLQILPLDGVLRFVAGMGEFGIPQEWGYFPLTDFNDSNPYCVCCKGVLTGSIAHVRHDDNACLEFRSLWSFLDAFVAHRRRSKSANIPPELANDRSNRSPEDINRGLLLLQWARLIGESDVTRQDAISFGLQLLSESEIPEFVAQLDSEQALRNTALKQLRTMSSPRAVQAIADYQHEFGSFIERCVRALNSAGVPVHEVSRNCLRLEPGPIWLDLETWYEERRSPGINEKIIERAKYFLTLRNT